MRAHVSLEVEGVVEAFTAEAAQVPLGLVVALQVSVQHPLELEGLLADLKHKIVPYSLQKNCLCSCFSDVSGLFICIIIINTLVCPVKFVPDTQSLLLLACFRPAMWLPWRPAQTGAGFVARQPSAQQAVGLKAGVQKWGEELEGERRDQEVTHL